MIMKNINDMPKNLVRYILVLPFSKKAAPSMPINENTNKMKNISSIVNPHYLNNSLPSMPSAFLPLPSSC
jgi:hypothetical protein